MKALHLIAWILVIVGGLNWGLKVFGADIATWGLQENVLNVVYALVGLGAVYELVTHSANCRICKP